MANWLVTGVSSGLGRALAEAAIARGDAVWGTVRSEADAAAFETRVRGHAVLLDIADEAATARAVGRVEAASGGIDILVNNAGRGLTGAIEETALAEARALFAVNLFGPIALIQAVLPAMRARGQGHIVNVSSVSGLAPWSGTGLYGASKYALECIGQTLAQEVAPFGIRVTNVAPGGLRTDFAGRSLARADRQIAAYDGGAHQAHAILSGHAGQEAGDPVRAAQAVLRAIDAPDPPLHLLLGADALHYVEDQLAAIAADIAAWRDTTLSIGFDAAPDTDAVV